MAECRRCGQTIQFVTVKGTEERIPLDHLPMGIIGPDRYRLCAEDIKYAEPVEHGRTGYSYGDHRITCPAAMRDKDRQERVL